MVNQPREQKIKSINLLDKLFFCTFKKKKNQHAINHRMNN
uniref:Uncharacterized protein n=1 Tax=Manihot esculenta TaxID=3983 RepID=A0A2C9UX29_MANES